MVMLPVAVQADHAGADARQHGFGEAAALVVQPVGGDQIAALGGQLLGHAVEGQRPACRSRHRRARPRTWAVRSPSETRSAASIRSEIGRTSRLAAHRPDQIAASSTTSATTA